MPHTRFIAPAMCATPPPFAHESVNCAARAVRARHADVDPVGIGPHHQMAWATDDYRRIVDAQVVEMSGLRLQRVRGVDGEVDRGVAR
jgi:hypothetical protein